MPDHQVCVPFRPPSHVVRWQFDIGEGGLSLLDLLLHDAVHPDLNRLLVLLLGAGVGLQHGVARVDGVIGALSRRASAAQRCAGLLGGRLMLREDAVSHADVLLEGLRLSEAPLTHVTGMEQLPDLLVARVARGRSLRLHHLEREPHWLVLFAAKRGRLDGFDLSWALPGLLELQRLFWSGFRRQSVRAGPQTPRVVPEADL